MLIANANANAHQPCHVTIVYCRHVTIVYCRHVTIVYCRHVTITYCCHVPPLLSLRDVGK
jgi:hypothetical protein